MRRVLTGLVLPALLSMLLVVPATAATAEEVTIHSADVILLATEGELGPLPGPTPGDPNASENFGAPVEYEAPFLWKASIGLLALMVGIIGALAGLYYLLVLRPRREASTSA